MNKDELSDFQSLKVYPPFLKYMVLLQDEFEKKYKGLRKVKSANENEYGKITGFLDGIDYALKLVDNKIDEGITDQNP